MSPTPLTWERETKGEAAIPITKWIHPRSSVAAIIEWAAPDGYDIAVSQISRICKFLGHPDP